MLFDPNVGVLSYPLLGTNQSGFGHVEAHNPIAGTWTAVIFTVSNAPYFGPVQFSYYQPAVPPGGLGVAVLPDAGTGADGHVPGERHRRPGRGQGLKLHLGTGGSADGSIPIILRALVPITLERRIVQRAR